LTELAREPATRTLALAGLGERDVASLIELTTAHAPAAGLVEVVHTETEGNPLFVGEIVQLLASEGRLDEPGPQLAIPQTVKEVIGRRLRGLSEECNRVLTLASVLGREFDLDDLTHISGLERESLGELLNEAVAERVVTDVPGAPARLRFSHVLVRDTLYDGL